MDRMVLIAAGFLFLKAASLPAATVLFCPFDSLEGWSVRAVGAASAAIVDASEANRCVEVTSRRGTVFVTRQLPLDAVRGSRVTVRCLVKSENVVAGPQQSSTAKVHLAVQTPGGIQHHNARFTGTSPWHGEGLTADVPSSAQRVVLNLGLEACFGRVSFDRLVVENDRRAVHPLSLTSTANAGHDQLGLEAFPEGTVQWEGVPFVIMDADKHDGMDCFRLQGIGHDDWPEKTAAPIPVNTGATKIYILHAALEGRRTSETPCAIWTAWFAGGQDYGLSLFEGRDIGAVGQTEDLDNWHVAWRQRDPSGKWVTFGVTEWTIYSDAPVVSLSCQAYHGAAPVVLAVTAVEEPPAPPPEAGEFDELGESTADE